MNGNYNSFKLLNHGNSQTTSIVNNNCIPSQQQVVDDENVILPPLLLLSTTTMNQINNITERVHLPIKKEELTSNFNNINNININNINNNMEKKGVVEQNNTTILKPIVFVNYSKQQQPSSTTTTTSSIGTNNNTLISPLLTTVINNNEIKFTDYSCTEGKSLRKKKRGITKQSKTLNNSPNKIITSNTASTTTDDTSLVWKFNKFIPSNNEVVTFQKKNKLNLSPSSQAVTSSSSLNNNTRQKAIDNNYNQLNNSSVDNNNWTFHNFDQRHQPVKDKCTGLTFHVFRPKGK
ncbi:hypothetical protein ABK040_009830 [Willaertia magna]